jgi:hypothetical protein
MSPDLHHRLSNADGTVNSTDYGLFVNAFGTVCN